MKDSYCYCHYEAVNPNPDSFLRAPSVVEQVIELDLVSRILLYLHKLLGDLLLPRILTHLICSLSLHSTLSPKKLLLTLWLLCQGTHGTESLSTCSWNSVCHKSEYRWQAVIGWGPTWRHCIHLSLHHIYSCALTRILSLITYSDTVTQKKNIKQSHPGKKKYDFSNLNRSSCFNQNLNLLGRAFELLKPYAKKG